MVGPARFLPIVLGFFFASYYMTFAEDTRSFVDTYKQNFNYDFIILDYSSNN